MQPQPPPPYEYLSVWIIAGIIVFLLPFFNPVFNWGMPNWLTGVGIVFILIGTGISVGRVMMK
jgi:hypothetical protein